MKTFYPSICLLCFILTFTLNITAQERSIDDLRVGIQSKFKNLPIEKVYLSMDKPHYVAGDTLWFKSFLLNGDHSASYRSDKIYVELINSELVVADRQVLMLYSGLGYGQFNLNPDIVEGSYLIRAYSNWQQNFESDYFFQKSVYINNPSRADVKINKEQQTPKTELPQKPAVRASKQNAMDLQFMPEGGYMVNGIYGRVAFKAIDALGVGVHVKGEIINSKHDTLAAFETLHHGMGSFLLLPLAGESYKAIYTMDGKAYEKELPDVKTSGSAIRIDALSAPDSIYIYIKLSGSDIKKEYTLTAMSSAVEIMTVKMNLDKNFVNLKLPKDMFPDGVVHFTLFSPEMKPLNERQVFINLKKKMLLKIVESLKTYSQRDSVNLDVQVNDENGKPIMGAFSVAVTDDGQVRQQEEANMQSHFLLSSSLKGYVEEPWWYFKDQEANTRQALDQLMLTQGWTGYKWEEKDKYKGTPQFLAEKDNIIRGQLSNAFNKPVPNVKLTLLSLGNTIFVTDTVSDVDGAFTFTGLPLLDSASYTIKIKNQKGKTSGANIKVEEFNAAPVKGMDVQEAYYRNSKNVPGQLQRKLVELTAEKDAFSFKKDAQTLMEVEIKSKNIEVMTKSGWDARIFEVISEEELKKMPRKTLFTLLKERIPGLNVGSNWTPTCGSRLVNHKFVNFLIGNNLISHIRIDKINTHVASSGINDTSTNGFESNTSTDSEIYFTNNFIFNNMNAEDIKEIRVYKGCVYYYMEITTRSDKGPFFNPAKGVYVYKPLPINIGKEFYNPKYLPGAASGTKDLRSTIFWDANVVTDSNGKARVSFFTADLPGTYTIKIEGTDMFGRFGYFKQKLEVRPVALSK